jgi:hypothetical protein
MRETLLKMSGICIIFAAILAIQKQLISFSPPLLKLEF